MKKRLLSLSVMALLSTLIISCGNNNKNSSSEYKESPNESGKESIEESISNKPVESASEITSSEETSEEEKIEKLPTNYILSLENVILSGYENEVEIEDASMEFDIVDNKLIAQGRILLNVDENYGYQYDILYKVVDGDIYTKVNGNFNFKDKVETSYYRIPLTFFGDMYTFNYINMSTAEIVELYMHSAEQIANLFTEEIAPFAKKIANKTSESLDLLFDLDFPSIFTVKENAKTIDYSLNYTKVLEISNDIATLSAAAFLDKYLGENVYSTLKDFAPRALFLTGEEILEGLKTYCDLDAYELLEIADDVLELVEKIKYPEDEEIKAPTVADYLGLESYEELLGEEGYGGSAIYQDIHMDEENAQDISDYILDIFNTLEETPIYEFLAATFFEDSDVEDAVNDLIDTISQGTKAGYTTTKDGQLLNAEFEVNGLFDFYGKANLVNGKDYTSQYNYDEMYDEVLGIINSIDLSKDSIEKYLADEYQNALVHYKATPQFDENDQLAGFREDYEAVSEFGETHWYIYDVQNAILSIKPGCSGYSEIEFMCFAYGRNEDLSSLTKKDHINLYYDFTTKEYTEDGYHHIKQETNPSNYCCGDVVEFTRTCSKCDETCTYSREIKHELITRKCENYDSEYDLYITYCYECGEIDSYRVTLLTGSYYKIVSKNENQCIIANTFSDLYDILIIEGNEILIYTSCDTDHVDGINYIRLYKVSVQDYELVLEELENNKSAIGYDTSLFFALEIKTDSNSGNIVDWSVSETGFFGSISYELVTSSQELYVYKNKDTGEYFIFENKGTYLYEYCNCSSAEIDEATFNMKVRIYVNQETGCISNEIVD